MIGSSEGGKRNVISTKEYTCNLKGIYIHFKDIPEPQNETQNLRKGHTVVHELPMKQKKNVKPNFSKHCGTLLSCHIEQRCRIVVFLIHPEGRGSGV